MSGHAAAHPPMDGGPEVSLDPHQIAAARLWAVNRFPYLASAVFAAPIVEAPGTGTVAADESWRFHIDPTEATGWAPPELGAVFVHLVNHLLRDHAGRARECVGDSEHLDHWQDSADAEVNDDLGDLAFPKTPVRPDDLLAPDGRLAEEYFRDATPRPDDAPHWRCGSAADGRSSGAEAPPNTGARGLDDEAQALLRRQTASDLLQHQRQHGDAPGGLLRWAEDVVAPTVDWRRELAAAVRLGLGDVAGQVDYSYGRPSRRSAAVAGVILPSLRRPTPEIAVVIDTSASMDDELLGRAVGEVDGILRAGGVASRSVRVLSCDVAATEASRVASIEQIALVGGGGTDLGNGIEATIALRPRPDVVVVLTDGFTDWPAQAPAAHTVIVIMGDADVPEPDWARVIRSA